MGTHTKYGGAYLITFSQAEHSRTEFGDGLSETLRIDNQTIDHDPYMKPLSLNITSAPLTQADPTSPPTQTQPSRKTKVRNKRF